MKPKPILKTSRIALRVKGFSNPVTVVIHFWENNVTRSVEDQKEGYTDGTSWSKELTKSPNWHAEDHIKWLGQTLKGK